ncbi:MAG: class I SAM-dependent methyltransferase [Candidatus Nanopelagicaceae bacterium]
MATELESALDSAAKLALDSKTLVRIVLSGRRRNMSVPFERIDIRPVLLKDEINFQVMQNDGRITTTKNISPNEFNPRQYLEMGYANILVEHTSGALSIRITKKGEAQVHEEKGAREQNLEHDRKKVRLLDFADPFLIEVGISDANGKVKPTRADKYLQVEEFLRLLVPTLNSAIAAKQISEPTTSKPLVIADLGCGNAYLTFAVHQYLKSIKIPVHVIGIDIRPESLKRNTEIAKKLGISKSIEFKAEAIDQTSLTSCDIAIALHACDTATDDAIAWAVNGGAKLLLVAPCCQHDLQTQMSQVPEPWNILTKHGLIKERLGDLMTDSLRAQILKLKGYRTEIIEFIGGEHTPRNIMIRAVLTNAKPTSDDLATYKKMLSDWKIDPALASRVNINE